MALFNLVSHGSVWRPQFGGRALLDIPAVLEQIKLLPIKIPKSERLLYLRAIDAGMGLAYAQNKQADDAQHSTTPRKTKS